MGILDGKTIELLRDGKILETLHKLSNDPHSTQETIEVKVADRNGTEQTRTIVVRKVSA